MGSRYIYYNYPCMFCGKDNEEVYYAPTCGFTTFECEHCGKENDLEIQTECAEEDENG